MAEAHSRVLRDHGQDGHAGERRGARRHAVPLSGRWTADGRWIHVAVETISPLGGRVSMLVPVPTGSAGTLSLDGLDPPIPAEVRWCRGTMAGLAFHLSTAEGDRLHAHILRHLRMLGSGLPSEAEVEAAISR